MEDDYKAKYMKYKMKYIDLKTRQKIGGGLFSSATSAVKTAAKQVGTVIKQETKSAAKEVGTVVKQEATIAAKDLTRQSVDASKDISRQAIVASKDVASQAINTATVKTSNMIQTTKDTALSNIPQ